ncbi:MAG TPA: exosortase/archaeosortase family protein [archaeon]|nr:exosortase/archaeosortase family protein [archaeon]
MKWEREAAFFVKFFLIFFAAEFLIFALDFSLLENFIAKTIGDFFSLSNSSNMIFVGGSIFEITASCTGLVSSSVLGAIIFSLKKPRIREKIGIFFAGVVLLLVLNYFRVIGVIFFAKEFGVQAGEITHTLSWFATSVFIIVLWYYFTKKFTGAKNFSGFL